MMIIALDVMPTWQKLCRENGKEGDGNARENLPWLPAPPRQFTNLCKTYQPSCPYDPPRQSSIPAIPTLFTQIRWSSIQGARTILKVIGRSDAIRGSTAECWVIRSEGAKVGPTEHTRSGKKARKQVVATQWEYSVQSLLVLESDVE